MLTSNQKLNRLAAYLTNERKLNATFNRMDWIENRIQELMQQYPDRTAHLFDSFKLGHEGLYADIIWSNEELWQAHVEELLLRVALDQSLDVATEPEILVTFSRISLSIPLHGERAGAYKALFAKLLPGIWATWNLPVPQEPYKDAYERIYDFMRETIHRKIGLSRPKPNPQRWIDLQEEDEPMFSETIITDLEDAVALMKQIHDVNSDKERVSTDALVKECDRVYIPHLNEHGTVTEILQEGRACRIMTDTRQAIQMRTIDMQPIYKEDPTLSSSKQVQNSPVDESENEAPKIKQLSMF